MIMQVHDELVLDVHIEEQELMKKLVKNEMENALSFKVPLEVEVKLASNWLDAH